MSRSGRLTRAIALGVLLSLGCLGFTPSPTLAEHRSIATVDSSVNESPVALGSLLTLFSAPSVAEISESRRREMPQASGPDVDGRVTLDGSIEKAGQAVAKLHALFPDVSNEDLLARLGPQRSHPLRFTEGLRLAFDYASNGAH